MLNFHVIENRITIKPINKFYRGYYMEGDNQSPNQNAVREYGSLFARKKSTILSIVILFLMAAAVVTLLQPFEYGAETKLLVIQNFPPNEDPYTAAKSNEYLSSVLAEVITTNSFFTEVMNAGFNINRNYFPTEPNKLRRAWKQVVQASPVYDTAILNISVYHPDKNQASQIIQAVNQVMQAKHSQYHGMGDNVTIRVIDPPVVSQRPVKPNVAMNLGAGFILGLVLALSFVYIFPEERYNIRLWPHLGRKRHELDEELPEDGMYPQPNGSYAAPLKAQEFTNSDEHMSRRQQDYYRRMAADTRNNSAQVMAQEQELNHISATPPQEDDLGYDSIMKRGSMTNLM